MRTATAATVPSAVLRESRPGRDRKYKCRRKNQKEFYKGMFCHFSTSRSFRGLAESSAVWQTIQAYSFVCAETSRRLARQWVCLNCEGMLRRPREVAGQQA
jgi:hypothetical protein